MSLHLTLLEYVRTPHAMCEASTRPQRHSHAYPLRYSSPAGLHLLNSGRSLLRKLRSVASRLVTDCPTTLTQASMVWLDSPTDSPHPPSVPARPCSHILRAPPHCNSPSIAPSEYGPFSRSWSLASSQGAGDFKAVIC